jgi:hypothetical protein
MGRLPFEGRFFHVAARAISLQHVLIGFQRSSLNAGEWTPHQRDIGVHDKGLATEALITG